MIGKKCKCLCREDLCLIENYDKAINDTTQIWDCHHRLEIDLNLSREQMKERGLYYDRPASELIFMTHADHQRLHKLHKNYMRGRCGELCPFYGHNHKAETKEHIRVKAKEQWNNPDFVKMIKEQRKGTNQGEANPFYGHNHTEEKRKELSDINTEAKWMNNGIVRHYVLKDRIEYYSKNGYVFGYKLKHT